MLNDIPHQSVWQFSTASPSHPQQSPDPQLLWQFCHRAAAWLGGAAPGPQGREWDRGLQSKSQLLLKSWNTVVQYSIIEIELLILSKLFYPFTQYTPECSEKYKNFKLKIPQPDSERRHGPDFRTFFGIMIGPFSICEIGKTWGTNKQVNKQTNRNWKFQFPTTSQSWFQNSFWNHNWTIFLFRNWQNVRYIKWEKALCKMRKSEKTTFQWPKVSKLLTTLPRHRPHIRTGLRF